MPIIKLQADKRPHSVVSYYLQTKNQSVANGGVNYRRLMKRAKELLELCDYDLTKCKWCIDRTMAWAWEDKLNWTLETVCKHWIDLKAEDIKLSTVDSGYTQGV